MANCSQSPAAHRDFTRMITSLTDCISSELICLFLCFPFFFTFVSFSPFYRAGFPMVALAHQTKRFCRFLLNDCAGRCRYLFVNSYIRMFVCVYIAWIGGCLLCYCNARLFSVWLRSQSVLLPARLACLFNADFISCFCFTALIDFLWSCSVGRCLATRWWLRAWACNYNNSMLTSRHAKLALNECSN